MGLQHARELSKQQPLCWPDGSVLQSILQIKSHDYKTLGKKKEKKPKKMYHGK